MLKFKNYSVVLFLIPVLLFFGIAIYSYSESNYIPQYDIVYYIESLDSNNPKCREYGTKKGEKLIILNEGNGSSIGGLPTCNSQFYLHSVENNSYRTITKSELTDLTFYNLDLNDNYRAKDPDGFRISRQNRSSPSPFFRYDYYNNEYNYTLHKSFSNLLLNTPNSKDIFILGFIKK